MIQQTIQKLVVNEVPEFQADRSLYSQLNSIEIVGLVDRLETEFDITIEPIEVDEENFSSLEALTAFISKKVGR